MSLFFVLFINSIRFNFQSIQFKFCFVYQPRYQWKSERHIEKEYKHNTHTYQCKSRAGFVLINCRSSRLVDIIFCHPMCFNRITLTSSSFVTLAVLHLQTWQCNADIAIFCICSLFVLWPVRDITQDFIFNRNRIEISGCYGTLELVRRYCPFSNLLCSPVFSVLSVGTIFPPSLM